MRKPLDIEDVEELELSARTPEECRTVAEILAGWAAERHPDDDEEVTPAVLLVRAGEQLGFADDPAGALEMFRRAVAAEGEVPPDVRCYLHYGLMQVGDVAGARRLAEEIRRSRPTDLDVYGMLADHYDLAGELAEANRWINLGLRRLIAEAEDDALEDDRALSLLGIRRRIRRTLGFPPDEFDEHPLLPPPIDFPDE